MSETMQTVVRKNGRIYPYWWWVDTGDDCLICETKMCDKLDAELILDNPFLFSDRVVQLAKKWETDHETVVG